MTFLIRTAVAADIPNILDLERACDTAAHWTEEQYRQIFQAFEDNHERLLLIAEDGAHGFGGFLVAHRVHQEWELENIVVVPDARRKGLATMLLRELVSRAQAARGEFVFLEVRESNAAARAFYVKAGFEETSRRKAYYANPVEDAVLYRLRIAS